MAARERVLIDVKAETQRYAQSLGKIPGITDEEAKKAAGKFVKRMRDGQIKAALAAEKAARDAAEAWEDEAKEAADKAAKEMTKGAKKSGDAWALAGKALGGLFAVDKILDAATAVFDYTNELQQTRAETIRLSDATGISTDTIVGLSLAVDRIGGDSEQARDALADFGERLFDAAQGGGEAEEAFRLLGFSQQELLARQNDVNGVLEDALDRYQRVGAGAERNAIGQQLFGDASLEVGAALDAMDLDEAIALADRYGRTVDEQAVQSTREWSRALSDLSGEVGGAAVDLGSLFDAATGIDAIRVSFAVVRDFTVAAVTEIGEFVSRIGDLGAAIATLDIEAATQAWVEFAFEGQKAFADIGAAVLGNGDDILDVLRRTANAIPGVTIATEDTTEALAEQPPVIDDINLALGRLAQQTAREAAERKKAAADAKKAAKERERELKEQIRLEAERAKAVNDFAKMEQDRAKRSEDATLELLAIQEASNRAILDDEGQILAALDDRRKAIQSLAGLTGNLAGIQDATNASEAQAQKELADLEKERAKELKDTLDTVREVEAEIDQIRQDFHDRQLDRIFETIAAFDQMFADLTSAATAFQTLQINHLIELQQLRADDLQMQLDERAELEEAIAESTDRLSQLEAAAERARLQEALDAINEEINARGRATQSQLLEREILEEQLAALDEQATTADLERQAAALDAKIAADQAFLEAQQADLVKAFEARKDLEKAGALISGAAAIVAALAPPPIGAGPIVGAALTAGITATTAAQVATISAQEAPQFPVGFPGFTSAGDTLPAILEPGEAVTTRAVTEALGGADEVQRMNQGGALGAQGEQLPPPMSDPNLITRAIGQLVVQEMGRGRELTREMSKRRGTALPATGKRPVYATRR